MCSLEKYDFVWTLLKLVVLTFNITETVEIQNKKHAGSMTIFMFVVFSLKVRRSDGMRKIPAPFVGSLVQQLCALRIHFSHCGFTSLTAEDWFLGK